MGGHKLLALFVKILKKTAQLSERRRGEEGECFMLKSELPWKHKFHPTDFILLIGPQIHFLLLWKHQMGVAWCVYVSDALAHGSARS